MQLIFTMTASNFSKSESCIELVQTHNTHVSFLIRSVCDISLTIINVEDPSHTFIALHGKLMSETAFLCMHETTVMIIEVACVICALAVSTFIFNVNDLTTQCACSLSLTFWKLGWSKIIKIPTRYKCNVFFKVIGKSRYKIFCYGRWFFSTGLNVKQNVGCRHEVHCCPIVLSLICKIDHLTIRVVVFAPYLFVLHLANICTMSSVIRTCVKNSSEEVVCRMSYFWR